MTNCHCKNNSLLMFCHEKLEFNSTSINIIKFLNLYRIEKIEMLKKNFVITNLKIQKTKTNVLLKVLKLFQNVAYLNLTENFMTEFQSNFIENHDLLQNLDLSRNFLKFLNKSSFFKLKRLLYLNLDENQLEILKSNTFFHLSNLKELNITKNSKILRLQKFSFYNLDALKIFNFDSKINDYMIKFHFHKLTSLNYGYLRSNKACCYLREINKNLKCQFKFKDLKNCHERKISIFVIIFLFLLFTCLLIFSIIMFYFSYKFSEYEFIDAVLNFSTTFYILFTFLYFLAKYLNIETINENFMFSTIPVLPCILVQHFYQFIIICNVSKLIYEYLSAFYGNVSFFKIAYLLPFFSLCFSISIEHVFYQVFLLILFLFLNIYCTYLLFK